MEHKLIDDIDKKRYLMRDEEEFTVDGLKKNYIGSGETYYNGSAHTRSNGQN